MAIESRSGASPSASKTILVLGAFGMLGHMLVRTLTDSHQVVGTSSREKPDFRKLKGVLDRDSVFVGIDGRDFTQIKRVIDAVNPDVLVNCTGIVKQKMGVASTLDALLLNSVLPHQLLGYCITRGVRVLTFSTDCVFRGTPGLKNLGDTPDATDEYGMTKRLGELDDGSALTLRAPFVGRQLLGHESFFEWILMNRGRSVMGYKNAIYSGMTTKVLARIVQNIIVDHPSLGGLFQVASEPISKFDLIVGLNEIMNLGITVEPDTKFCCDRSLDGTAFSRATQIQVPSWFEMLDEFSKDQDFYS